MHATDCSFFAGKKPEEKEEDSERRRAELASLRQEMRAEMKDMMKHIRKDVLKAVREEGYVENEEKESPKVWSS